MTEIVVLEHTCFCSSDSPKALQISEDDYGNTYGIRVDKWLAEGRTLYFGNYFIELTEAMNKDIGEESISGNGLFIKEIGPGPPEYGKTYKLEEHVTDGQCSLCECSLQNMVDIDSVALGSYKISIDHRFADGVIYGDDDEIVECCTYDRYLDIKDQHGWVYTVYISSRRNRHIPQESFVGRTFVKKTSHSVIYP